MRTTGNKIVVKPIFELPSTSIAVPARPSRWKNGQLSICGEVVAVGPGRRTKRRNRVPVDVRVGQYVYHSDSCGRPIDDDRYAVITENDVMFVSDELLPAQWIGAKENYDQ